MKTFILLSLTILLLCSRGESQIIGGNGEGFTSVASASDIPFLLEASKEHPIAIRWPGGGDSRVAFPALNKPGLGMNKDSIEKLYQEFRDNEGNVQYDKLEKELKQAEKDALEGQSALLSLIKVSRQVKGLQVDFCLNVLMGSVESNISAIRTLLDSGVNIISIVAGNECFFSYRFNWEKYKNDFEPILRACEKEFPDIPRLICLGQDFDKKNHLGWNNSAIEYINSTGNFISGVDVHYYMMKEIKSANTLHPKSIVYKSGEHYPELEKAFDEYIRSYRANDEFGALVNYLKINLPGKIYHCTEFGDKEAEYWSNTIANAAHMYVTFCKYRNDFDILLMQNLIANWFWASRRVAGRYDDNPDNLEKISRCHWYSFQLANELPFNAPVLTSNINITQPGIYYYYYDNAGGKKYTPEFNIKNGKLISFETHYLTGKYNYSSAGSTGFMAKGSDNSLEVRGIDRVSSKAVGEIPYNSFGYVKIVVE